MDSTTSGRSLPLRDPQQLGPQGFTTRRVCLRQNAHHACSLDARMLTSGTSATAPSSGIQVTWVHVPCSMSPQKHTGLKTTQVRKKRRQRYVVATLLEATDLTLRKSGQVASSPRQCFPSMASADQSPTPSMLSPATFRRA